MIAAMGYHPDDVYVCNVVKCRPPNNRKPEPDEMASCLPYLVEQLDIVKPKVIVALGGTAAQGLIGAPVSITRIRGEWRLYRASIPMMPTFHPAYLLRTPAAKREVWADLQAVLHKIGRPLPSRGGGGE
jgi:DNA polymerase